MSPKEKILKIAREWEPDDVDIKFGLDQKIFIRYMADNCAGYENKRSIKSNFLIFF